MFESFKPKSGAENEPTNPERRKALETITAMAVAGIGSSVLTEKLIKEEAVAEAQKTGSPQVSSAPVQKFESTRGEAMEQLIKALASGNKETYGHALDYAYGLKKEKSDLLKRKLAIVQELTKIDTSNTRHPFYLLEHDRINTSLEELNVLIQANDEAMAHSPHFGVTEEESVAPEDTGYIENQSLPNTVEERKHIM